MGLSHAMALWHAWLYFCRTEEDSGRTRRNMSVVCCQLQLGAPTPKVFWGLRGIFLLALCVFADYVTSIFQSSQKCPLMTTLVVQGVGITRT
jgi:hypothetical protein